MKDLKPISAPETDRDLGAVFSAGSPSVTPSPSPAGTGSDLWVQTSIKMREETRRAVKLYALEHDMKMQKIIDLALRDYLGGGGTIMTGRIIMGVVSPGRSACMRRARVG